MKKNFLYSALLCASAALISSCTIAEIDSRVPAADGSEIIFGSRAGFENADPETKTVYTGEYYTVGTTRFERIDWVDASDKIQVYCPEAVDPNHQDNTSHYQIEHIKDHDMVHDYAVLSKLGSYSLQWNGDGEHNFYAMYPSSLLFNDNETTVKQGVKMDGKVLNGIVPSVQNPVEMMKEDGNYTLKPDMRYAYMAAKSKATRKDGTVSLSFVPVVTAVQITMVLPQVAAGQSLTISEIQVSGTGIAGAFTANLGEWSDTYPVCTNAATGSNLIQVTPEDPISLALGKTLTFTIFVRPGSDISDLKVSISSDGASYVGQNIEVNIPKGKKTLLNGLKLPSSVKIDASNWMSQLDPATQMNRLSIPGTGSTFSYNYNKSDKQWIQSQTLTLEQQWNKGIRAFEIISERQNSSSGSLGSKQAMCNNENMGSTVQQVFDILYNKVTATGSKETAILILTYQPAGDYGRDPIVYLNNLKVWINSLGTKKDALAVFTPTMTLAEAQNKILIIVRPTQRDEDYQQNRNLAALMDVVNGLPVLVVDGCGTGKDRWGARGYKINGDRALDISNYASNLGKGNNYMEYFMSRNGRNVIDPNNHTNISKGDMDFAFKTTQSDIECWYQEWARVIPSAMKNLSGTTVSIRYPYWFESYNEKLSNVVGTFEMAVSDSYPQYVFINSLCGHYGTKSHNVSLEAAAGNDWGGTSGDVAGLANDINQAFYQYVRTSGFEQKTGPTGIVMMNFVSDKESDGASFFLPGTIISNNFKHNVGQN